MKFTSRRLRSWSAASVSAFVLAAGCYYDNFSKVDAGEEDDPIIDGEGGEIGSGGREMGGSDNQGGEPASGGEMNTPAITIDPITVVITQGDSEVINLLRGVDDDVEFLEVTDAASDVPSSLKATLNATNNGVLTFAPHADFWGSYRVSYTVEDSGGNIVSGDLTVFVTPRDIDLALVEDEGYGGFIVDGDTDDRLGVSITGADLDGNGIREIVIGAPGVGAAAGRVVMIRGTESPSHISLPADADAVQIFSGTDDSGAGVSLAAGTLSDDEYDDIVIGSTRSSEGRVYVVYGSESYAQPGPEIDLVNNPPYPGYTITGSDLTGLSVAVGPLGGNALLDVLVLSDLPPGAASVDAVFSPGGNGAIDSVSNARFTGDSTSLNKLSPSTALVGDLVGDDGLSEVLLATNQGFVLLNSASPWPANLSMPLTAEQGWQGGASGPNALRRVAAAGNFEAAEAPTIAHCNGVDGCLIVPFEDTTDFLDNGWGVTGFGGVPRVFGNGNLNADEWDDLLFTDGGAAYVVWGRSELPSVALNVTALDDDGVTITPTTAEPVTHMAMLGDVNGDGVGDVGIGIPDFDGGKGRVYVIFGTPGSTD